jgi:hypothetical protein
MTWFNVGALLALAVLLANSAFVIARRKRMPVAASQAASLKKKMPISAVLGMLVMVAAWVVGLGAPVFWPETAFGDFMSNKLNLVAYCIWCGVAYVAFHVAWHFTTSRLPRKNDSAV